MTAPNALFHPSVRRSQRSGWRIPRAALIVWGEAATLAYLAVPMAFWLTGWLHAWLAWPLVALLGGGAWCAWQETKRHFQSPNRKPDATVSGWSLVAGAAVVALWAFYSGAGGFTHANMDWEKHFAVLRDLLEQPWPLRYVVDGQAAPLSFYLAYYLPAAAVGSVGGWWSACFALCAWTVLGAVLAGLWFMLAVERAPFGAAVFFIFASGLDFLGERLVEGGPLPPGDAHIDWWAGYYFLNFPSHQSQLGWAPHHSLAAWLITGLLATQLTAGRSLGHAGLLCGLAALWSPFTLVGLVPFALVMAVRHRGRAILAPANLVGGLLALLVALFLAANTSDLPKGFMWETVPLVRDWNRLLLVHLLEWGVFYFFASELLQSAQPTRRWLFWTTGVALLLLPFYRLGIYNDWAMRTTIPALLLLWIAVARSLIQPKSPHERPVLLLLAVIGAFSVLTESSRSWRWPTSPQTLAETRHVPTFSDDDVLTSQYLGSEDAFFFRHLAKASTPLSLNRIKPPVAEPPPPANEATPTPEPGVTFSLPDATTPTTPPVLEIPPP